MTAQLLAYNCPHCGKMTEVEPAAGEQILTCPNPECQKPFRLEVPRAQPTPALIVPSDESADQPREAEVLPLAQVTPMAEPELATVRPQMFRRYPFRFLLLAALVVGGAAGIMYGLWTDWTLAALVGLAVAAYGAARFTVWWLRNRSTSLTVTSRRCVLRTGVLTAQNIEIPHADVRQVHAAQSFTDRLFDVGDLVILGPESGGLAIQILGVPRADEIAALIRTRRQP